MSFRLSSLKRPASASASLVSSLTSPPQAEVSVEAPTPDVSASLSCLNCGSANVEKFCPRCGQEAGTKIAPLPEMVADAAGEFLKWDGKLLTTLRGLLRPGFLTQEYLSGRRVPYLAPFRLYLWAIGFYLLVFSLPGTQQQMQEAIQMGQQVGATSAGDEVKTPALTVPSVPLRSRADFLKADYQAVREARHARRMKQLNKQVKEIPVWIFEHLSFIFMASQPLCAAVLFLLYRRQRRLYAEHLITVLHNESAIMLTSAPLMLLQSTFVVKSYASLVLYPLYYFFSFRRLYGPLPGQTVGRTLLKTLIYFALVCLMLLIICVVGGIVFAIVTLRGVQ